MTLYFKFMIIGYRPGSSLYSLYHYSASYIMLFCPLWMYIVNRHFTWFEYLYSWLSYNPSIWCIVLNFIFKQTTMEQICLASQLFNFPSLLAQVLQRLTVFAQWIQITGNTLRGYMMTSSNGSIFRVTGPLCGEFNDGRFPTQRPVRRGFDVFFDLRLNKWLSKHSSGWWFEMPSCSLWRHCNEASTARTLHSTKSAHCFL